MNLSLYNFSIDFFPPGTSWRFSFSGHWSFMRTLNWPFASKNCQLAVSVNAQCVCARMSVFSGQADKEFLGLTLLCEYRWLASPLLQMTFNIFCVHGESVFMSVPYRETRCAHVNCEACITVYVTAPSLSLSAPPPQRGVVLMTLPRQRSS